MAALEGCIKEIIDGPPNLPRSKILDPVSFPLKTPLFRILLMEHSCALSYLPIAS